MLQSTRVFLYYPKFVPTIAYRHRGIRTVELGKRGIPRIKKKREPLSYSHTSIDNEECLYHERHQENRTSSFVFPRSHH